MFARSGLRQCGNKPKLAPGAATNEKQSMNYHVSIRSRAVAKAMANPIGLALLLALLSATGPALAAGRNPNPGIAPANSNPSGHSYGEWGAVWWRWAYSIPFDENPVADTTGEFAATGQIGPVWFLAGTFGGEVTRTVEVPAGKGRFFPIANSAWVTTCITEPRTIEGIRPLVAPQIDATTQMAAEIDGVPVQNLSQYRAESPLFCISLALDATSHLTVK